jgi:hypothetical protein
MLLSCAKHHYALFYIDKQCLKDYCQELVFEGLAMHFESAPSLRCSKRKRLACGKHSPGFLPRSVVVYNIDGGSSERPRSSSKRSRTFNASDDSDSCA